MDLFQVILLSIIQGITEFLPISSSAHLILFSQAIGEEDQGIVFDVAVHFGTLLAAIYYFRDDLFSMFLDIKKRDYHGDSYNLLVSILISSLPILVLGAILTGMFRFLNKNPILKVEKKAIEAIKLYLDKLCFKDLLLAFKYLGPSTENLFSNFFAASTNALILFSLIVQVQYQGENRFYLLQNYTFL